jgi:hypothetical protein
MYKGFTVRMLKGREQEDMGYKSINNMLDLSILLPPET